MSTSVRMSISENRAPKTGFGAGFALAPRRLMRPKWIACGSTPPRGVTCLSCQVCGARLPAAPLKSIKPLCAVGWNRATDPNVTIDTLPVASPVGPAPGGVAGRGRTLRRDRRPLAPAAPLIDPFARRVRDLRLSVTDRCNFRCTYCMPDEGMQWLPRSEVLSYEELARIARICVERWGFDGIRITGGEPTVRAHLPRLFELLRPLGVDLAMTTNGVRLPELAHDLAAAGPAAGQRLARHAPPRDLQGR